MATTSQIGKYHKSHKSLEPTGSNASNYIDVPGSKGKRDKTKMGESEAAAVRLDANIYSHMEGSPDRDAVMALRRRQRKSKK